MPLLAKYCVSHRSLTRLRYRVTTLAMLDGTCRKHLILIHRCKQELLRVDRAA